MRVLVACEESQTVCKAFRALGHEAYSCDILDCSGGHPEWHIKGDAIEALYSKDWDLVIAHPTCTYLTNSGVCWLYNKDKTKNYERWKLLSRAVTFFNMFQLFAEYTGTPTAIENPIPHKYATESIKKYTQLIQPYYFGHMERKATCFWLYNLPPLLQTNNVYRQMLELPKNVSQRLHYLPPGPERAKLRSKTFPGIAAAMASQWSEYLMNRS